MNTHPTPHYYRILLCLAIGLSAISPLVRGQGCVAIRQMGGDATSMVGLDPSAFELEPGSRWTAGISYEYFRSHRHFIGTVEQTQRAALGTEVVNEVNQADLSLSDLLTTKLSLTLGIPYFSASRSSLYEHDRIHRYTTHARGIGDARVTADMWILDPIKAPSHNLSLGVGVKAPTGNSNVKDTFHTAQGPVYRNVDQSIQPGDGAWGTVVEAQGFQRINATTSLYFSGFYLINPKETNGTRTTSANPVTSVNSVADQFQARLGAQTLIFAASGFAASLGARVEGVPAHDLIGGDSGFRRPGYVVSVEPGVSFSTKHDSFALSVPVAIIRDRIRSYADKLSGGHGDAAFADYLISVSYTHHF